MEKEIEIFMRKLRNFRDFSRVKFVVLYGSQSFGKAGGMSDFDFAVYYEGSENQRFRFMVNANFEKKFDVKVFQDLPLFIQKEVLKGKLIYAKDKKFAYDIAYETIKRFESFKKYYYDYINTRRLRT